MWYTPKYCKSIGQFIDHSYGDLLKPHDGLVNYEAIEFPWGYYVTRKDVHSEYIAFSEYIAINHKDGSQTQLEYRNGKLGQIEHFDELNEIEFKWYENIFDKYTRVTTHSKEDYFEHTLAFLIDNDFNLEKLVRKETVDLREE
jgi:hypothetical protein